MELNYVKQSDSNSLIKEFDEIVHLEKSQNYIPIYGSFFNLTENNFNNIQLNNTLYLKNVVSKVNDNVYLSKIGSIENSKEVEKAVFFKFCPLMDPVKYMIGKFDLSDNF